MTNYTRTILLRMSPFGAIALAFGAALTGCADDRDNNSTGPTLTLNFISFANPQVGQESKYIYFTADGYDDKNNTDVLYHPDTLIVTVVEEENGFYNVVERLSAGSRALSDSEHAQSIGLYSPNVTRGSRFIIHNDSLFVDFDPPYGTTLFYYAQFRAWRIHTLLPLTMTTADHIRFNGWKPEYCECFRPGYTLNFSGYDRNFDSLNVFVNDSAMTFLRMGFTTVYSPEFGLVRTSYVLEPTQLVRGWDLLTTYRPKF